MPPPSAVAGTIDLSAWNFEEDGAVKLNGEWKYYPLELLTAAPTETSVPQYTQVPDIWGEEATPEGARPGWGFATYALDVLVPPSKPQGTRDLGLEVWIASSAYVLYVNGERLAQAGTVGTTPETSAPQYQPKIIELPESTDVIQLVFQVSNFTHVRGGMKASVNIGSVEDLRTGRDYRLAISVFLTGASIMIGLYHLMLWWLRRKELSYLMFALICISVGGRIMTTSDIFILLVVEEISFGGLLRTEYLSMILMYLSSWLFIHLIFPRELPRWLAALFGVLVSLYGVMVVVLPIYQFTSWLPAFQALVFMGVFIFPTVVILAAIRRREGAIPFAANVVLLAALVVYDLRLNIFPNLATVPLFGADTFLLPAGYFICILTQAGILARRLENATTQMRIRGEELAAAHSQLDHYAQDLERAVEDRTSELETANEKLAQLSRIDELTQLANRRAFDEELARAWGDHRRRKSPLALVMIDVDHFKGFNDRYGHVRGDEALRMIADAVTRTLNRPRDMAARYGGEEMAVLLADTGLDGAVHVGKAVRAAVEALQLGHADSPFGMATISAGVASLVPDGTEASDELVRAADAALYRAKSNGRNRVET